MGQLHLSRSKWSCWVIAAWMLACGCRKAVDVPVAQQRAQPEPLPAMATETAAAVAPAATPTVAEPPADALCEVEMAGQLTPVLDARDALAVYVSVDDCMAPDARMVARMPTLPNQPFFVEVFVPCGMELSLCAAVEPRLTVGDVPKPTRRYGQLPRRLKAVGEGEIEFKELTWQLADGPQRTFADGIPWSQRVDAQGK